MQPRTFGEFIYNFIDLGQSVIPLLVVVSLLFFVYGVARFIRASANDKDFDDKKKFLVWGVVAMFVLMSIWGIIAFMKNEFGFTGNGIPLLPTTYR